MEAINAALEGKKTYLVVIALIVLNVVTSGETIDLSTVQETLTIGLVATFRSALSKVGT